VGMGETNIRGDIYPGDGVYKSTDGGKTWKNIGLKKTRYISKIIIDPQDPDIVFIAAFGNVFKSNSYRGVYKSTNGGETWQKVLYKNEETGAIDIVMDPNNSHILYAALWQAYRTPWMLSSGGSSSGIYKSTDEGNTWTELTNNQGLPKGILGKIGLAVAYHNSNRVYATIEAKDDQGGVYKSDDAVKTWNMVNNEHKITLRPWYYTKIYVNPDSDNVIYTVDERFLKSTDGGKTFKSISTPHGDNHALWINPDDGNI